MARVLKSGVQRRAKEFPRVELISVKEGGPAAIERRTDIQQLLARLYILSHKRGRPRNTEDDESYAA